MSISVSGKKNHMLIGKLLSIRHPDIADSLMKEVSSDTPTEKDLDKIPSLFQSFCSVKNISPEEYQGTLKATSKVDIRRLFVSVILHFYSPNSFHQPSDYITIRFGLTKAISQAVKVDIGLMSRTIRQVIVMERAYDSYREKVLVSIGEMSEIEIAKCSSGSLPG